MTTALTISRANEIYSKIENPMLAVAELGKMFHQSQIMGVATPGDGAVLALTCMCEGITPLEFAKTYHIIKGRPSMKADAMSARFRQSGGKCRWINLGDDGKEAKAEFSFDGQTLEIGYTIDDAKKVMGKDDKGKDRIDQPDSNWAKDRGAMLRARLITKAIRIIAPELIAGVYTPEELEDSGAVSTAAPAKDRASRKRELEADTTTGIVESTQTTTAVVQPVEEPVIDVAVEPAPFAADAAAVSDDSDLPTTMELLHELAALGKKMPSQVNPGSSMDLAEVGAGVCKAAKVSQPKEATRGQIRKLIAAFRKALGEK
jgi:hypothetical protein